MDDVQPYPGFRVDLDPKLKEKFGTNFTKMVRLADKYYQSIGFPELPKSFFEKSIFVESDAVNRKVLKNLKINLKPSGLKCFPFLPITPFLNVEKNGVEIFVIQKYSLSSKLLASWPFPS